MTTIFGLAGASLAFYHTAKPEKKAMAKAILLAGDYHLDADRHHRAD